jgi:hypothetical protein
LGVHIGSNKQSCDTKKESFHLFESLVVQNVKGKFENIQSLRRHYPDQVRGYDLSRFTLPWQGRHPFVFKRQKYSFFRIIKKNV